MAAEDKELADIDAELARRGVAPQSDELSQIDAELARRKDAARSPAGAGIANFTAGIAGLPVDTIENAINLPIAGVGAAATAFGHPEYAPDLLKNSVGGSEYIRNLMRKSDLTNPDMPPTGPLGRLQYELASKGGFVPGAFLSSLSSIAAERLLGPDWGGVGALLPAAGISAYNEARAPSLAAQKAKNQVRDQTIREASDDGFVMPPSQSNPTFVGNRLEGFAGKAAVKQDAALRNAATATGIAKREIGLDENSPLTMKTVEAQRDAFAQPYRDVASISGRAKAALELLKKARADAKDYWFAYDKSGHPDDKAAAQNFQQKAGLYERVLEQEAARSGKPQLIADLRQARTNIAKTFDVERALNLGDGTVDPQVFARLYDKGAQLTGGLEMIAKFALGPGKQVARAEANVPAPGVSALDNVGIAGLGLGGYEALGPKGLALAAIPLARHGVREGMLSKFYQRNFAQPNYEPAMQPELVQQLAARLAAMENAQPK